MARRNILTKGDPTLEKMSREVTDFDDRLHILLEDMKDTLTHANGIGLAAPQVGILRRVALVLEFKEVGEDEIEEHLYELINPVILEKDGEYEAYEGCLSIPGYVGLVTRPERVKVRAQDRHGTWYEVEGEGLTARALCHEIDHLDGLLYNRLTKELINTADMPDEEESE
ncbi:MAG: peptide deformylase [Oscillospiraceae bacterium]|nr:peptide deformylase [Oscillospiraceae bacterium]